MVVRVLIAVAVVVMFLSGCGSVREAMNKEEQASTQAQTEAETTAPTANDSADAAALSNEKKVGGSNERKIMSSRGTK